ncbi:M24 family metallopeptidase, partial [Streptomyces glaucescens]|uniref:M24 family metallopeptidase n=1 Tax=Streptomyces glaucescens TaxID=1907 RepID=UPI000A3C19AF
MRTQIIGAVRKRLQDRGLDAYIAYTPSNVFYTTGFRSFFLMEWWRMLGTVLAVVPADPTQPPALVVSDFEAVQAREESGFDDVRPFRVWVELRDARDLADPSAAPAPGGRPAQYDTAEQDALLRSVLADRDLLSARIGTDLRYVLHDTVRRVAAFAPQLTWEDMTDDLYELRSVKYDFEIERLRRATELSEAGMSFAVRDLRPGLTAIDLRNRYQQGVLAAAMADPRYAGYSDQWMLSAVSPSTGAGAGADPETDPVLADGALIKFDCGVTVGGYRGDGGRTFAYRTVQPAARRLHDVLLGAHREALSVIRPGVAAREVFQAAQRHIRAGGYPSFTRGHYGHSVGIDTFHEEPPYLSADEERPLLPG